MQKGLLCLLVAAVCWAAASGADVAKRLAEKAKTARASGAVVRAYLLYSEAVKRDPRNASYRISKDVLAASASLLQKADLEKADIKDDIKAAEQEAEAAAQAATPATSTIKDERGQELLSIPHVVANDSRQNFDLHGDEIALIQKVSAAYGVRAAWDPQLATAEGGQPRQGQLSLQVSDVDFRAAMEALTAVTDTFVFPLSSTTIYFARDTEEKRNQLEPNILLTVPLPNAVGDKEMVDVANAVRSVLNLRSFGWNTQNHTVFVRDRVSKAMAARVLLEALMLPKAQVALEVQVLTLDAQTDYHYGLALPTSFQLADFGHINHFQSMVANIGTFTRFLAFGAGSTLFGVGVMDATLFATYTKSMAKTNYDAVLVSSDGETVNFHVGEKYPIPQTLYTGFQKSSQSIYNPIPQFNIEDLGLVLKMTPRVNGGGEIALDLEAEFKQLGSATFNTVPSVSQRKYTGNVVLREGEWAILAGLEQDSSSRTRNGLAGISDVPGLNEILSENTRDRTSSKTLVVIKPSITRLPMSADISPQYLLGPIKGAKVLL
jgi:type II secretory pathway component GspD/PulD (secretin)